MLHVCKHSRPPAHIAPIFSDRFHRYTIYITISNSNIELKAESHLQVLPTPLSAQIVLSLNFRLPAPSCPSYTASWMPQAGVPQAGSRAAIGPGPQRGGLIGDRREGHCKGGRPGGWPGLSRAPTRTPQSSNMLASGAGTGAAAGDRGQLRTGTGCVVLRGSL